MSLLLTNPYARFALVAACLSATFLGCGDDDMPVQTTAPAITGAADTADADKAPGTEAPEDEPSADPASDKAEISRVVALVLTGDDPMEVCGELVTKRYLRRAYGDRPGCEAAQIDVEPADRVRLSRVVVLPDSLAQASVTPSGGIYDGDRLRAELVLDGGVWQLDSLRSNVPVGP